MTPLLRPELCTTPSKEDSRMIDELDIEHIQARSHSLRSFKLALV